METISRALQPHKERVGMVASVLTIGQFFSGVFICLTIHKKKSTKDISPIPFIGGLVMGIAMYKYGILLNDPAMITVNLVAIALNICYCIFFAINTEDKINDFLKPFSVGVACVAVLWGYVIWEDPTQIEFRFGLISTVMMLLLLGTPLKDISEIIENKDASKIPFVMTLMGTLVTFSWLLYGVILLNNFMIVQNVVGFVLCAAQLALIFIYPGNPESKKKD